MFHQSFILQNITQHDIWAHMRSRHSEKKGESRRKCYNKCHKVKENLANEALSSKVLFIANTNLICLTI